MPYGTRSLRFSSTHFLATLSVLPIARDRKWRHGVAPGPVPGNERNSRSKPTLRTDHTLNALFAVGN
jgi:hypothetical protein